MSVLDMYKFANYIIKLLLDTDLSNNNTYKHDDMIAVASKLPRTYIGYSNYGLHMFRTKGEYFEGKLLKEISENNIIDKNQDLDYFIQVPCDPFIVAYIEKMIKDINIIKERKIKEEKHISELKIRSEAALLNILK